MYRILPTSSRKSLIVTDEVVAQSATDNNVDVRQLDAAIQIAEERFIRPAICPKFFDDFRDKKNNVVTSVNLAYLQALLPSTAPTLVEGQIVNAIEFVSDLDYRDFWFEHLWKWLAEAVVYIASPTNYSRFTSQGEMNNNPNNATFEGQKSASVPLASMKWKMDKMMQDRIDPLRAAAELYLYDNLGSFPLVDCKKSWYQINSVPNGVSKLRKSGWIFGIYNDDKSGRCDPCTDDLTKRR